MPSTPSIQDRYPDVLSSIFTNLDFRKFTVQFTPRITFICGGPIASNSSPYPASLRERILLYLDEHHNEIEQNVVVAESFADYFQKGQYSNLLIFEEDIANVASLIVICLESAGSLVEFGLFCNHASTSDKLLVYIPEEHYDGVDSFIALGPLAQLKASSSNSVVAYPFPDSNSPSYEDIDPVVGDLVEKLESSPKTAQFDVTNSGHLAFLIHDVISLCTPIKKQEILSCLNEMGIDSLNERRLSTLLYLLIKIGLVGQKTYSHVDYFFSTVPSLTKVTFGKCKDMSNFDRASKIVEIKQTFMLQQDGERQSTKKRRLVQIKINEILKGQS
ncbi:retron St85 family effector protein [Vibrio hangzhouensis]|uniref:retron St85 family effector protein n=1 Tax=Vibrio hangzhouensis TaxID=462991 RepID=UPI001C9780E8|nr:retron St85 family effector protein [Vibrio hangzhouensis]MBY6199129.1 retron St85 family effector protein [Vibrio hangzhouensis]